MPRWEVCRILAVQVSEERKKGGGLFSSHDEHVSTWAWKVERFHPNGKTDYIDQTAEWENRRLSGVTVAGGGFSVAKAREPQLNALIARLGLEGWEAMPLVIVGGETKVSSRIDWYFKRQLPDE